MSSTLFSYTSNMKNIYIFVVIFFYAHIKYLFKEYLKGYLSIAPLKTWIVLLGCDPETELKVKQLLASVMQNQIPNNPNKKRAMKNSEPEYGWQNLLHVMGLKLAWWLIMVH